MKRNSFLGIILVLVILQSKVLRASHEHQYLSRLKQGQAVAGFRVARLYSDNVGEIVAAKFWHTQTGAPVFVLQIETVPQVFTWVDAPVSSGEGLPHALEHLLVGKGIKGRYFSLLRTMRFARSEAATTRDFNFYGLASSTGLHDFFELFHAWLDALYRPDFTDLEAQREFYHFAVTTDSKTQRKTLTEQGTVYHEMEAGQGRFSYYFALNKLLFGEPNPLAFYSGGVPAEMRGVTPDQIRRFHAKHYHLGPATGFIFVVDPRENVPDFLQQISRELQQFSDNSLPAPHTDSLTGQPKYPIVSSEDFSPGIYPFPSGSEAAPGTIHFAWRPVKTQSFVKLKLLQLLFHGFAAGEQSLLHQAVVDRTTRDFDSGATGVDSEVSLADSPYFPVGIAEISGIPGNRISRELIERLRTVACAKIKQLFEYSDKSKPLTDFNELIAAYAKSSRRSENVWIRNVPGFGSGRLSTDWKERFDYLEMDPQFTTSLTTEHEWDLIAKTLSSGKNIWREVIQDFHLLDLPYATASTPSRQLLARLENEKQEHIRYKTKALMEQYHSTNEQEALSKFQQEELSKTKEVDLMEANVSRPPLTNHPPMTPDDSIRYRELRVDNVPITASIFDRPPTLDLGLSFDLSKIPRLYYKYLPIFPRCLDSMGLKQGNHISSYSELQTRVQKEVYAFSVGYDSNPVSKRMELTISASGSNHQEFKAALSLIQDMMHFNFLDPANVDRLRDIVSHRLSDDDSYTKRDTWTTNPAYSFRYQDDPLFLAVYSQLTRAHWDARLKWLLHEPVTPEEVDRLSDFAKGILEAASGQSRQAFSQQLATVNAKGLQAELIDYWRKNIDSFAEAELMPGLKRITTEVEADLRKGPGKTIEELKTLQRIILDRGALRVELAVDQSTLDTLPSDLLGLLSSIPLREEPKVSPIDQARPQYPIRAKLQQRYRVNPHDFPWYVGLINPNGVTANVTFYSDFSGYSQLDRESLVRVLSSKLLSGSGPHTFYMKTWEAGLAYDEGLLTDPARELMTYYAIRVSDIPSLLNLVNSLAENIRDIQDKSLVEYALRQSFPLPRSTSTFSERGKALAQDLRDNDGPERIRRFSTAILRLRKNPNLFHELTEKGFDAICGVMVNAKCAAQQRAARSIFFFAGPEKLLVDTESRLGLPKLLFIWPSDYWIE